MKSSDLDNEFGGDVAATSRSFIQIIWQRKAFVILGACVGLAVAFLWHTQKANVYASKADLLVTKRMGGAGGGGILNSNDPRSGFVEDFMSTHMVLLKSPYILSRAVEKENLNLLKTFAGSIDPVGQIQAGLIVSRESAKENSTGERNNIITIAFRGPVSEDCNKVIDAVVEAYKEFLNLTYRNVSDDTIKFFQKARDSLYVDLKDAEKKYSEFRERASDRFFGLKSGTFVETERIVKADDERSLTVTKLVKLRAEIDSLDKAIKEGKGADVVAYNSQDGPGAKVRHQQEVLKVTKEPLIKPRIELNQLLTQFGDGHPAVKALKLHIETLEKELAAIAPQHVAGDREETAKMLLSAMKLKAEELENVLGKLEELVTKLKGDAKDLLTFTFEDDKLKNEVFRIQKLFDTTLQKLTEIDLVRDQNGFEPRLLSPPNIGLKVAPVLVNDLALGLVLGLMVGFGLAYLADLADKSFRSPDEIRRQLGLPIVGHIPFFQPDPETSKRRADGDATIDPMLCSYFKPKSLDSEAYRAVRTSMFFSTQGQGHKIIQVTSPNKGDGKSLLISNLAIVTAQSGKRVLMIDADCRRPRQHKVFNIRNDIGLTTVLNGTAEAEQAVQETTIPGLSVMGSGPIPPNPSELLLSPRFKELLENFRGQYDFVFVDTPPLLAVTDPCIVAGLVDGLFLAIRLTRKGRPDAERAREILQSLSVRTFGIVVNGVTRTNAGLYSSAAYDYTDKYMNYEADDDHAYYYAEDDEEAALQNKR